MKKPMRKMVIKDDHGKNGQGKRHKKARPDLSKAIYLANGVFGEDLQRMRR